MELFGEMEEVVIVRLAGTDYETALCRISPIYYQLEIMITHQHGNGVILPWAL